MRAVRSLVVAGLAFIVIAVPAVFLADGSVDLSRETPPSGPTIHPSIIAGMLGAAVTLIGVFIGTWATRRVNKESRTTELFASYLKDVYPKEGDAFDALKKTTTPTRAEQDSTRYVGNWFDVYSALALNGSLSSSLRKKIGLDENVRAFWDKFSTSEVKSDCIGGEDWTSAWPNMKALAERKHCRFRISCGCQPARAQETSMEITPRVYTVSAEGLNQLEEALKGLDKSPSTELNAEDVQVLILPALVRSPGKGGDPDNRKVISMRCPNCNAILEISVNAH